jgi:hypothetical protein
LNTRPTPEVLIKKITVKNQMLTEERDGNDKAVPTKNIRCGLERISGLF